MIELNRIIFTRTLGSRQCRLASKTAGAIWLNLYLERFVKDVLISLRRRLSPSQNTLVKGGRDLLLNLWLVPDESLTHSGIPGLFQEVHH